MSTPPLDVADSVVPELETAMREVERTFKALRAAQTKLARSSRPDSLEVARLRVRDAERAYRGASDRRDELVQLRNARLTQRGDARGELWSRPDGVKDPVVPAPSRNPTHFSGGPGVPLHPIDPPPDMPRSGPAVFMKRTGGYDPKLGPKHPDNQDPTLPPADQDKLQRTRLALVGWYVDEINKLAKDAESNAREDARNAEESGQDESDKYTARADTARHYAAELRRILRGVTWDEDFVARVAAADKPARRQRR